MDKFSIEYTKALIEKIEEKRLEFFTKFSTPPKYVILPYGSVCLLQEQSVLYTTHFNRPDQYCGMYMILSRACEDLDNIVVY